MWIWVCYRTIVYRRLNGRVRRSRRLSSCNMLEDVLEGDTERKTMAIFIFTTGREAFANVSELTAWHDY